MIEYWLFFFPTSLIKIWIAIWVMMPQYYGEYAVFNIMSDRLEKFERSFRNVRNWFATKFVGFSLWIGQKSLKSIKYVPSSKLQGYKELVTKMDHKVRKEIKLRENLKNSSFNSGSLSNLRDSTVFESNSFVGKKAIKPAKSTTIYTP